MQKKGNTKVARRSPPNLHIDDQPLLKFLVAQAVVRGDTLAALAKSLGVTYARLAQWRRNQAHIRNARRPVLERAAAYLGWPVLYVLIHADIVRLSDLVWPVKDLDDYVAQEVARMRQDRRFGPLVPPALESADAGTRLLTVYLFNAAEKAEQSKAPSFDWLQQIREAAETHLKDIKPAQAGRHRAPPSS